MATAVVAGVLRPRWSLQVAFTVTVPGEAPVVFSVAVLPLPVMLPPVAVKLLTVTGTLSGLVRLHARRITRARNCWRILGRLFDCEVGGGAGISILLRLRINDVHGGGATAARNAVGINTGGGVVAGNLSAGAAPVIGQGVFRIEVAGSRGLRNRLTLHHFRRLNSK